MEDQEFLIRKKISSSCNRLAFLKHCISEQVLPRSAPPHLRSTDVPFTNSARAYLEEACQALREDIVVKRDQSMGIGLTHKHKEELKRINAGQQTRLKRKLEDLCRNSMWGEAGRNDIVTNLSSRELTIDEKEALSYGLKFDAGKDRLTLLDHISKNYRNEDADVDKGFVQGIVTCCKFLADKGFSSLPRRYQVALEKLARDDTILITSADKGGGIIIMNKTDYIEKMNELLKDEEVYKKKPKGYAKTESDKFNTSARKILKKSEMGKRLLYTLEENPEAPKMRGLPKVHKTGIPMRPITSGIGSAPHRLAKALAKPLSAVLGSISEAHLHNSGDLLNRLQKIDLRNKKLASFDVKALFTNVPIEGALKAIEKALSGVPNDALPLPKMDYLALVKLCLKFNPFMFNQEEYAQYEGLAMGSPLSPVAACLFMETLEADQFSKIMGENTTWLRYVDDVLIIAPENLNLQEKLAELNQVHQRIQFTFEEEENHMLNFLDTTIIRGDSGVKFRVYRKPTNKEDYIHFFSSHSMRTKSGIVIGFFLRAFRICSEEYIEDEVSHIFSIFRDLKYPKALLIKCRNKARQIRNRKTGQQKQSGEPRQKKRLIIVPHSKHVHDIAAALKSSDVKLVEKSSTKIRDMVKTRHGKVKNENSMVYKIPCGGCQKSYIGETHRGLRTRIMEHKRDLRHHRMTNSMTIHAEKEDHLPKWEDAEALKTGLSKTQRKLFESALIDTAPCTNHRSGFYSLANALCILTSERIKKK